MIRHDFPSRKAREEMQESLVGAESGNNLAGEVLFLCKKLMILKAVSRVIGCAEMTYIGFHNKLSGCETALCDNGICLIPDKLSCIG